jgi:hypothetical protein
MLNMFYMYDMMQQSYHMPGKPLMQPLCLCWSCCVLMPCHLMDARASTPQCQLGQGPAVSHSLYLSSCLTQPVAFELSHTACSFRVVSHSL